MKLRLLVALALAAALIACGEKKPASDLGLTADETYLVDSYVRVRKTGAMFPYQRVLADSLLDRLAGDIDTVRIARTSATLNANPERWAIIFQTIEERMSPARTAPSESTRT